MCIRDRLDIVAQVVEHGDKAVAAIDKAAAAVTRNKEEMCIRDRRFIFASSAGLFLYSG